MTKRTLPTVAPAASRRSDAFASPAEGPVSELELALAEALSGEVQFDGYTRHLFSTDASMYSIRPVGVVFPKDATDVEKAVKIAAQFGVPVLPRGAGTSLAGQTVGEAVILDFSRHMNAILSIDAEGKTARVQPGVVQDDLNRAVHGLGLMFAPDTSTSSRATIGGMIGNNSCGARSARYGMTIDHVESLDVVLSDGSRATFGPVTTEEIAERARADTLEGRLYREIPPLIERSAEAIRRDTPPHWRRSGGYRMERVLPEKGPLNLSNLVVGSEGTLAVTVEATVRLVPRPLSVAALVGHFDSVSSAIRASDSAMACGAMAVELMDRNIIDLARQSPVYGHLAKALVGDPGAILWVEFYGDTPAEAAKGMDLLHQRWSEEGHGYALVPAPTAKEQKGFQELRKAGQALLMLAGGPKERSLAFVEDTAVDPSELVAYSESFSRLLEKYGMRAGFYGHASAGCLHIRPYLDLTRPGDIERMRGISEEVVELVRKHGGMNSSEHGDGLVRSEFNRRIFGEELYGAMCDVKQIFDPEGRMNPGKKVDAPSMTDSLREPNLPIPVELKTHFHFDFEDGMRGSANSCQRIGICRKGPGTGGVMCPSYMATLQEEHSTRGRANALMQALSSPDPHAALGDERLHEVLDLCLECKACQTECPLSVDMATMKSEALAHRYEQHGTPLSARFFGNARLLNQLGSAFAPLSNLPGKFGPLRILMEKFLKVDRRRPLPQFASESLPKWFRRRKRGGASAKGGGDALGTASFANATAGHPPSKGAPHSTRRSLIFLADSFSSYTEPEIGKAAIELLEAAGWDVQLVDSVCCGRSLLSKGLLKEAKEKHADLLKKLGPAARAGIPIVGVEPSCVLTLKDELLTLTGTTEDGEAIARQSRLADDLLAEALEEGTLVPDPARSGEPILFHGHCHQKAEGAVGGSVRLLQGLAKSAKVDVLDAGCCGMAGSFGFEKDHYDISMKIGGMRLFPAVEKAGEETKVAATGVSCRQQIAQGTERRAKHPIVLLRESIDL